MAYEAGKEWRADDGNVEGSITPPKCFEKLMNNYKIKKGLLLRILILI